MIPLIILFGSALALLGLYLIHPGLAVLALGVYLIWLGQQSARQAKP